MGRTSGCSWPPRRCATRAARSSASSTCCATSARGGVASALSRTALSDGQREMVGLITSSAETLESLLSDVLDLARIESGRLELKAEDFDLAQSVRDVAALFETSARAKGLALIVEMSPEAAGIYVGDAPRIRQVISNLVSNAVKFTAEGSVC